MLSAGDKNTVSASYSAEIHVLNPQLVTVECYYFPFLYAPAEKGSEIGRVIIKFKEKEVASVPIAAEEKVLNIMPNKNDVRLQKFYMADCGVASRRKSEEIIEAGKVKVNGHIAHIGDKINPKRIW